MGQHHVAAPFYRWGITGGKTLRHSSKIPFGMISRKQQAFVDTIDRLPAKPLNDAQMGRGFRPACD